MHYCFIVVQVKYWLVILSFESYGPMTICVRLFVFFRLVLFRVIDVRQIKSLFCLFDFASILRRKVASNLNMRCVNLFDIAQLVTFGACLILTYTQIKERPPRNNFRKHVRNCVNPISYVLCLIYNLFFQYSYSITNKEVCRESNQSITINTNYTTIYKIQRRTNFLKLSASKIRDELEQKNYAMESYKKKYCFVRNSTKIKSNSEKTY